jgi:ketosteroid isomerase-like protein
MASSTSRENTMRTTLLLMSVLVLNACSGPEVSVETEGSASRVELGQMNRDFAAALNAKDAKAAAALYTETAILSPPGEPIVQGRQAIEEYWRSAIESGAIREVSVETMDAHSSGSLGYETGSFVLTVNGPDGKPMVDRGRYIELLRRESDGAWRSTHGIWNASPE